MGGIRRLEDREFCPSLGCSLHPYRLGKTPRGGAVLSPLKAIRKHCLECVGGSPDQVRDCQGDSMYGSPCALHPYRFGRNPKRKGVGSNGAHLRKFQFAAAHGAGQAKGRRSVAKMKEG
jgi:hypothetical protein